MTDAGLGSGDPVAGIDIDAMRTTVVDALTRRGWANLLGKQRGGEQSLLEHSLAVFDVLAACIPLFAAEARPALTVEETHGLLLAAIAHDAGKASPEYQAYLRGERQEFAGHVCAESIREVVIEIANGMSIQAPHIDDIVSEAVLHDRYFRKNEGEVTEWGRTHVSPRWRKLADFVNHADSVASAEGVAQVSEFLERNPLLLGAARLGSYTVRVRGVSTTFLHEAAHAAFTAVGFSAITYFDHGGVYAGVGPHPDPGQIRAELRSRLDALFAERTDVLPGLAVGAPLQDFLPRKEYVHAGSVGALLRIAARRVGRKPPPTTEAQRRSREADRQRFAQQWHKRPDLAGDPTEVDLQALFDVGPEACAFKITKEIFKKVLGDSEDAQKRYEEIFGAGAYDRLMRQSTYMPVQDYALCVRPWHALPMDGHVVGALAPEERLERLLDVLEKVVRGAIDAHTEPLPQARLLDDWSDAIVADLTTMATLTPKSEVESTLLGYTAVKRATRERTDSTLLCAQCAALIAAGQPVRGASAALGNKGSYSNRRMAFDKEGQPPLCGACVVDIELGQLCLGRAVETVIAIVPRRSLGPAGAREVARRIRDLRGILDRQLSAETMDPTSYVALALPQQALRATTLAEAAVRPVSETTRKKQVKKLLEGLQERLGADGLREINGQFTVEYDSIATLAAAIMDGSVPEGIREDPDVAAAVAGAMPGSSVDFAAVTPNLVLVSLDRYVGGDCSAADRSILSFGLAALFAIELDSACIVAPLGELRTAVAMRAGRCVYVPANGPARALLDGDWIDLKDARRWLDAVRAGIVIQEDCGANTLLEVFKYPSAGFAVRRIETKTDKTVRPWQWQFIEALKEVLG